MGRAGKDPFLVAEVRFGHFDGGRRRRIEGGSAAEQIHDLYPAVAGALHDFLQSLARHPTHFDQIGERYARDSRIAHERNHRIAVAAEHERRDVPHRHSEFQRKEMAEAGRIKNSRHAHNLSVGEAGILAKCPNHRIKRIRDANNERARRVLGYAFADRLHDFQINAEQIVPRHSGPSGNAGRHDADVRAGYRRVVA